MRIGIIYSYVEKPDGVWWQLDDNTFVKHEKGAFDDLVLQNSVNRLNAAKDDAVKAAAKKRTDANTNPLYNAGKGLEDIFNLGNIKWIFAALLIPIILGLYFRAKG